MTRRTRSTATLRMISRDGRDGHRRAPDELSGPKGSPPSPSSARGVLDGSFGSPSPAPALARRLQGDDPEGAGRGEWTSKPVRRRAAAGEIGPADTRGGADARPTRAHRGYDPSRPRGLLRPVRRRGLRDPPGRVEPSARAGDHREGSGPSRDPGRRGRPPDPSVPRRLPRRVSTRTRSLGSGSSSTDGGSTCRRTRCHRDLAHVCRAGTAPRSPTWCRSRSRSRRSWSSSSSDTGSGSPSSPARDAAGRSRRARPREPRVRRARPRGSGG